MKYTFDEVLKETLEYFGGDELATNVWMSKYALKDSDENFFELTPKDMHHRLAKEFARIEEKYPNPLSEDEIFDLIDNFKYIVPQGSPMAGIGNTKQIMSISNCFVSGVPYDSYGGILWTDQQLAQLYKRRCGVGADVGHIRPSGVKVTNAAKTTTGVVPFMERYSNTTREVAMEGRRGALLLSYPIEGMDAKDFINAKSSEIGNKTKVTGANISIKISDDFIKAVKEKKSFTQKYPYDSADPIETQEIDAKELWDNIVHNAWKDAEPGLLLWDTIKNESIGDCYKEEGFEVISTNPCGEIVLCLNDSCRLLLLNLLSYIVNPFSPDAYFDREKFIRHAQIAERLMDDIVDLELEKIAQIQEKIASDPEPEHIKQNEIMLWEDIKEKAIKGRRTGLGFTALGDMIAAMNLTYGTEDATKFASDMMKDLALASYRSSVDMAKERGAFPIYSYEKEKDNPFIKKIFEADESIHKDMKKYGRRGISLNTISPAGSVSIETQTTSGIEPAFALRYKRRRKITTDNKSDKISFTDANGDIWEEYEVLHPSFSRWLILNGYHDLVESGDIFTIPTEDFNIILEKSPYHNAGANDIDWREKVKMQGALQYWIDHSISNTTNLPESATEEDISDLYMLAHESGCKGVTVYREGSRTGVLVSSDTKVNEDDVLKMETHAKRRPKIVECDVIRFNNNNEKWIAFLGLLDDRPYEIFTGLAEEFPIPNFVEKGGIQRVKDNGKGSRYDFIYTDKANFDQTILGLNRTFKKEYWNYAKLVSGLLRHRMPLLSVIHLLNTMNLDSDSINTWMNGVIRTLKKYVKEGTLDKKAGACPECGGTLQYSEGCLKCPECGTYNQCN